MDRVCTACGKQLEEDARFCSACGTPVRREQASESMTAAPAESGSADSNSIASHSSSPPPARPVTPQPPESVFAPPAAGADGSGAVGTTSPIPPEPDPAYYEDRGDSSGRKYWIGGTAILLLILAGLYYWLFLADDFGRSEGGRPTAGPVETSEVEEMEAAATTASLYYATSTANIRDQASIEGSEIVGKLSRGDEARGKLTQGGDWLELEDGQGFVFMTNLTGSSLPELAENFGRKRMTLNAPARLLAAPSEDAELRDELSRGLTMSIAGITAGGYAEVILRKGGVGYIANGTSVLDDYVPPKTEEEPTPSEDDEAPSEETEAVEVSEPAAPPPLPPEISG